MSTINTFLHRFSHGRGNPPRHRALQHRLRLECLEQRALLSVVSALTVPPAVPSQNIAAIIGQQAKLLASNGQLNDAFGTDEAISGNTVVVGAVKANGGTGAGLRLHV